MITLQLGTGRVQFRCEMLQLAPDENGCWEFDQQSICPFTVTNFYFCPNNYFYNLTLTFTNDIIMSRRVQTVNFGLKWSVCKDYSISNKMDIQHVPESWLFGDYLISLKQEFGPANSSVSPSAREGNVCLVHHQL